MNILVFNAGSSSLNYKLYCQSGTYLELLAAGKAHRVGVVSAEEPIIEHYGPLAPAKVYLSLPNHRTAAASILDHLLISGAGIDAIGHRFVHGGDFSESTRLTEDVLTRLKQALPLAPVHNPNSMSVIELCRERLPGVEQYAAFDTAYHRELPEAAVTYALPASLRDAYSLRKSGFHGLSYQYISEIVPPFLGVDSSSLKMIACHLGTGGSSAAAILDGKPVETSMGLSPLAGLVMSSRPGDLDPEIPLRLIESGGLTPSEVRRIFNQESGLLGLSSYSSDMRDILRHLRETGDSACAMAFEVYAHRLKLYIGAFIAALGGLDVLVFTDDIGVQVPLLREVVCAEMDWIGLKLDPELNQKANPKQMSELQASDSRVKVIAVPTDEELIIAREARKVFSPLGS